MTRAIDRASLNAGTTTQIREWRTLAVGEMRHPRSPPGSPGAGRHGLRPRHRGRGRAWTTSWPVPVRAGLPGRAEDWIRAGPADVDRRSLSPDDIAPPWSVSALRWDPIQG